MAFSFIQKAKTTFAGATDDLTLSGVAEGSLIVMAHTGWSAQSIVTWTIDNGATIVLGDRPIEGVYGGQMAYSLNTPAGDVTTTLTFDGSHNGQILMFEFTDDTSPDLIALDVAAVAAGTELPHTQNITTTEDNTLMVTFVETAGVPSGTPTGYTGELEGSVWGKVWSGYNLDTGVAAANVIEWPGTGNQQHWTTAMAFYIGAAAAGGANPRRQFSSGWLRRP